MVDNFKVLEPLLDFSNKDDFYYLQILKRQKDNPEMKRNMVVLKDIFIFSIDDYLKKKEYIVKLCTSENARAYLRVNKRNAEKVSLEALKLMATYIASRDYKSVRNVFTKAAGQNHSDSNKKWIVDLDDIYEEEVKEHVLFSSVKELVEETGREFNYLIVPTKNGSHLICPPFNLGTFVARHGAVDVHKDNPTILFCLT